MKTQGQVELYLLEIFLWAKWLHLFIGLEVGWAFRYHGHGSEEKNPQDPYWELDHTM
jgi:hypothetical protein